MTEEKRDITGTVVAEARRLVVKKNKANDGHSAEIEFSITQTREKCARLFGEDFASLAFASMVQFETSEGETEYAHLAKTITASDRFRFAKHVILVGGYEIIATPLLGKVTPVDKIDQVSVEIRLDVHVGGDDDLGARLVGVIGESVDVNFSPAQKSLPGIE